MRSGVPGPADMQGKSFWVTATFMLDGQAVTVPVSGGNLVWDGDSFPSTRIADLQVPQHDNGTDLLQSGLIGSDGHRLVLTAHLEHQSWPLGEYLVTKVGLDGAGLVVHASDLTQLVTDHHGRVPIGVHRANMIQSVLRQLLNEDKIDVTIAADVPNPVVPRGFAIATDRGAALEELLTALEAVIVPGTPYGVRVVKVADEITTPGVEIKEGQAGTLVDAPLELDRSMIFNHVVACVKDSSRVAEAINREGRYGVDRFGWRTKRIESDSIASFAQAQSVAIAELARCRIRPVTVPVECFPDWRIEPYEPVAVSTESVKAWGRVTGFDYPLTHDGTAVLHIGMEV